MDHIADETMICCIVSKCFYNDKEGACIADGGMIQVECDEQGIPRCDSFETDPRWIEEISPLKA